MKKLKIGLLAISVVAFFAFTKTKSPTERYAYPVAYWQDTIPYHHYDPNRVYLDPNTGDSIQIWMDPSSHKLRNRRNNNDYVTLYVDPVTADTFYGEGYVVNNMVVKVPDGKYKLDEGKVKIEGNKLKYKEGSYKGKVKVTDDAVKTKEGHHNTKVKVSGDSVKVKKQ
jgi:hypothetical protein